MKKALSVNTIHSRIKALRERMEKMNGFDTLMIISRVNQFYFTGTIQDGVLVIQKNGEEIFFVRKSVARAKDESAFEKIIPIRSYKDMRAYLSENLGHVYIEKEIVPLAMLDRIQKYFKMEKISPLDGVLSALRAVKSDDEVELIRQSAYLHAKLMNEVVPSLLREGISETDFAGQLYAEMLRMGHHGVSRFAMFQMEAVIGQLGFGINSIYPTNFDGPGGMKGMYPAVPILGERESTLKQGELVFVDVGFGYQGYHSDKTQIYAFGSEPDAHVLRTHRACMDVLKKAESLLKPGADPGELYDQCVQDLPEELSVNFMGKGADAVRFLGHGVGLYIDELPIITSNYHVPLQKNMIIAIEPKCAIEGVGLVGVEETYVITEDGAQCLTGGATEIIVVPEF